MMMVLGFCVVCGTLIYLGLVRPTLRVLGWLPE